MGSHDEVPANDSDASTTEPECAIAITSVRYDFHGGDGGPGQATIQVAGTAVGITEVDVSLSGEPLEQPVASRADVDGDAWEATFELSAALVPFGARVTLTASSYRPDDCDAAASRTVHLGHYRHEVPQPVVGCASGLEKDRNRFAAGYADRFVASRAFSPLLCSLWTPTIKDRLTALGLASSLNGVGDNADALAEQFAERLGELGERYEREIDAGRPLDMRAARAVVARAYEDVFRPPAPGNRAETADRDAPPDGVGGLLFQSPVMADWQFARMINATGAGELPFVLPESQGVVGTANGDSVVVLQGVENYFDIGWLGVIFYDRLRFRPSGLVAGDEVYSLALSPGEEVTLTQRSETKRSFSFEEVVDRTMEEELEFNSTWSTGVTQQDTNTDASAIGGNLGASVGVDLFGVLQIGVDAGINVQDSHTKTTSRQRELSQQTTRRVSAKAREQHKTTFRVGTDAVEEFGSRRVLRNANPARALTLTFYKLYQKHRVLLERYDAKLCMSFCLDDPGLDSRREFVEELAKLEPKVTPGVCPAAPNEGQNSQTLVVNNPVTYGTAPVDAIFTWTLPPGTVLSNWQFTVDSVRITSAGTVVDVDRTQFWQMGLAADIGATFVTPTGPQIGSSGPQRHVVRIPMPGVGSSMASTVSVTATMTWSHVAAGAVTEDIRQCIAEQLAKIRASFSPDRVRQILSEVRSGARELVFKRLFETLLPTVYPGQVDPPCELLDRIRLCFDWNEATIQYLPWWMTATGRKHREELRQLLLKLPGDIRSDLVIDDFLVASKARVYLPVKLGCERNAFRLLTGKDANKCVDDFLAWRLDRFGPTGHPLPGYRDVTAIGPSLATPAGAADWAHDWERARARFLVLDEWAELLPTDGVHVEPSLSTCAATDEFRSSAIVSDLETSATLRDSERARADLERSLAARQDLDGAVLIVGEPWGH